MFFFLKKWFFHLVDLSPYPYILSINLWNMMIFLVMFMKKDNFFMEPIIFLKYPMILYSFILIFLTLILWLFQTSMENNFLGLHSMESKISFKLGMILFIISEICFFFSFFWCYFHSALSSDLSLGVMWPPKGMLIVNPYSLPLLNSLILISSGLTITLSHYEFFIFNQTNSYLWILMTIILGWMFLLLQLFEYNILNYSFSDSIYGSIFFLGTGFHGLHVFLGKIMLTWMLIKSKKHFSSNDLISLEMSIWYWHFVDVVWLFLYFWFYWWPI